MSITATFETSKGNVRIKLFEEKVPLTVANFVNLIRRKYYDGLAFHRVIDNFMVQGGCPLGTGTGDPGYRFEDEFDKSLRHNKPGMLSMANAGPATNGSQFFITHVETSWLNDKHAVFGEVVDQSDMDVINQIRKGDKILKATVEGDIGGLYARMQDRIDAFNKAIDNAFPDPKFPYPEE